MDDIKDLYDLIPEGMFSNQKELEELIAKEGIGSAYELVPEGMFSNQDEFMAEFNVKKKEETLPEGSGIPAEVLSENGEDPVFKIPEPLTLQTGTLQVIQPEIIPIDVEASKKQEKIEVEAAEIINKKETSRALSYLDNLSGYGKKSSQSKVYYGTEGNIEEWTNEMLDKGISEGGIANAISMSRNSHLKKIAEDKEREYNKGIDITARDRVTQSKDIGEEISEEEVKTEKNQMLESELRRQLPERFQVSAKREDKIAELVSAMQKKIKSKTLKPSDRDLFESQISELTAERIENEDIPKRLYSFTTGRFIDREKATDEDLEFQDKIKVKGENLTDKEKTLENTKKAYHRYQAIDAIYNQEVTFSMRDGREITAPLKDVTDKYSYIIELDSPLTDLIKRSKAVKRNWVEAKSQFEAINQAYQTNTDPAKADKGYWSAFGETWAENFDSEQSKIGTESSLAKEYVNLMDDLGSYTTPQQKENAKATMSEVLGSGTVHTLDIGKDILVSALLTKNASGLLGISTKLNKIGKLMSVSKKFNKTHKFLFNFAKEAIEGGATFAPTEATFAEGAGEGGTQAIITALGGKKFKTMNKFVKYLYRVSGGTVGETIQEYGGAFAGEFSKEGKTINDSFKASFGRDIEDATDRLMVTLIMSAGMSAAFNGKVFFETREELQKDYDEGNIPSEKMEDVERVLNDTEGVSQDVIFADNSTVEESIDDDKFIQDVAEGNIDVVIENDKALGEQLNIKVKDFNTSTAIDRLKNKAAKDNKNSLDVIVPNLSKKSIAAEVSLIEQEAKDKIKTFNAKDSKAKAFYATDYTEPVVEKKKGSKLFTEPNAETKNISTEFKKKKGIEGDDGVLIKKIDKDNSKKIADEYEAMEDGSEDAEVQKAYSDLAEETLEQHKAIQEGGYEIEIWEGEGDPYASSEEMISDIRDNKRMYVFSTEAGFGDSPITDKQRKQNKLLQDSGMKDKNGKPLLYNDVFRFVHDFFGHSERGNGFGPIGEENAWDVHSRMYSPLARRAMTTETRGQNNWVNFGPQMRNKDGSLKKKGDEGYLIPKKRAFAEQKMGLLPEQYSEIAPSKKEGKWDEWTENPEGWEGNEVFNSSKGTPVVEYKGKPMPGKEIKKAIGVYASRKKKGSSKEESANSALGIVKDTKWYKELSSDEKTSFDVDFKKSLGVEEVLDPLKTADIKKQSKAISTEIKARKDGTETDPALAKFDDKELSDQKIKLEKRVVELSKLNPLVKQKARTVLKNKLKDILRGVKEGVKITKNETKDIQKKLKEYADSMIPNDAARKAVSTKIINVTKNNIAKKIAEIDAIAEDQHRKIARAAKKKIKSASRNAPRSVKGLGEALIEINPRFLDKASELTDLVIEYVAAVGKGKGGINNVQDKVGRLIKQADDNRADFEAKKFDSDYKEYVLSQTKLGLEESSILTKKEFKDSMDSSTESDVPETDEGSEKSKDRVELERILVWRLEDIKQKFEDSKDLTSDEKSLLKNLLKIGTEEGGISIDNFSNAELKTLNNVISELITYNSFNLSGPIEAIILGKVEAKNLKESKIKTIFSKFVDTSRSLFGTSKLADVEIFFKAIAGKKGKEIRRRLIGNLDEGGNKTNKQSDVFNAKLDDLYRKLKNEKKSLTKLGVVSYLFQNEKGMTQVEMDNDFQAKKLEIELEIAKMREISKDKQLSGKRKGFEKAADELQEAYDNHIKDAKTKEDVLNSLDDAEKAVYDFALNEFSDLEGKLKTSHEKYTGSEFISFDFYIPTAKVNVFRSSSEETVDLEKRVKGMGNINTKQSGTTQKRVKMVTKNSDGTVNHDATVSDVRSVHIFNFNQVVKQKYREAQYDINTLKARRVLNSMMNSKDTKDFFGPEIYKILVNKLANKIALQGGTFNDGIKESSNTGRVFMNLVNYYKALKLKTVDQWVKQPASIMIHSAIQLGPLATIKGTKIYAETVVSKEKRAALDKLTEGSEVSTRMTMGESTYKDKKSLIEMGLKKTNLDRTWAGKAYLKIFPEALAQGDNAATKASWLAAYVKALKDSGEIENYSDFDIIEASENINMDAVRTANSASKEINANSDHSDASDMMTKGENHLVRTLLYNFRTFQINMFLHSSIAIRDITNPGELNVDKNASARYLAGSAAAMLSFQAIKQYVVNEGWDYALDLIFDLEDEDTEEEREKKLNDMLWSFTADALVGGAPGGAALDEGFKRAANGIYNLNKEDAKRGSREKPSKTPFYINGSAMGAFFMPFEPLIDSGEILNDYLDDGELSQESKYLRSKVIMGALGEGSFERLFSKAYSRQKKETSRGQR